MNTKNSKRKKRSGKGKLISAYLEGISLDALFDLYDELKDALQDKPGLYALYKDSNLHYIGMSKNLFGRIDWHRKDHHKGKWNYFSAYILRKSHYSKDMEAVMLRIGDPKGNKKSGNFHYKANVNKKLKAAIKERCKSLEQMFW